MMISMKAREEKNRYMREWRKRNKRKVKTYNERYWERKADERRQREADRSK